jgi:hypothetical protein
MKSRWTLPPSDAPVEAMPAVSSKRRGEQAAEEAALALARYLTRCAGDLNMMTHPVKPRPGKGVP